MNNPDVYIFVNGNTEIGFGHVARSLILAKEFRRRGLNTIFIFPSNFSFLDEILKHEFSYIKINSFENRDLIANILSESQLAKICILDLIEKEYNQLSFLKDIDSAYIVSITLFLFDLEKRFEHLSLFSDYSDNETITVKRENGNDLILYKGKDLFTFRDEFKNLSRKIIREKANRILVTMGGTDPFELTFKVLNSIRDYSNKEVVVVLNDKSTSFEKIKDVCAKKNIILKSSIENISKYMIEADIIILNGGLTRYEACITKTPFIAISIHEIQYNITKKITDETLAVNLGVATEIEESMINDAIENLLSDFDLRKKISQKMDNIINVNGEANICNKILKEYSER